MSEEKNIMVPFIPSEYVADYAAANGWEFSDRDKAALVHHWGYDFENELSELEKLKGELSDDKVVGQVDEYMARESEKLSKLKSNDGSCVFALMHYEEHDKQDVYDGFFAGFENALARGVKLGCEFNIGKYEVVPVGGLLKKRACSQLNPYMVPDFESKETNELVRYTDDDDDGEIGAATFAADGTLLRFWCYGDKTPTKEQLLREMDPESFENAFVNLPNPFERGDIVRFVSTGQRHGGETAVVSTSQEDWAKYLERVATKDLPYDFFDCGITVYVVGEDGDVRHEHIPTAYLEPYEPAADDRDRRLLEALSHLMKHGGDGLDWFLLQYRMRRGEGSHSSIVTGYDVVEL